MTQRVGRSDLPTDPAGTVRTLGICRGAMVDVLRTVKPTDPASHAASMVVSAIDGFAAFLAGERYFFLIDGGARGSEARGEPVKRKGDPQRL